jgi:integrase
VNGKRQRRFVYGKTHAEALGKLRALERERDAGRDFTAKAETVGAFLERWIRDVIEPNRPPKTAAGYRDLVLLHIIPAVGRYRLAGPKPEHVAAMLDEKQASGLSLRTVHHIRAALRAALNQALKWGLVTRNVAALTGPVRLDDMRVEPHTPAEVRKLRAETDGHRLSLAFRLSLTLGLRQGETLGLRWSDLDLERDHLEVRQALQRQIDNPDGKDRERSRLVAKSRRTLALPPSLVQAFIRHRDAQAFERVAEGALWRESVYAS